MLQKLRVINGWWYLLIGLAGLMTLLLVHSWSPRAAGFLLGIFFLFEFFAVKKIFEIIKSIEGYFSIDLKDFVAPLVLIFSWLMYSFCQLLVVFYIFHTLNLSDFLLKWIFPLVAFKSVWLAYQMGQKPKDIKPKTSLLSIGGYLAVANTYISGFVVAALMLELMDPFNIWLFDVVTLGRLGVLAIAFLALNSTVLLYHKVMLAKYKELL